MSKQERKYAKRFAVEIRLLDRKADSVLAYYSDECNFLDLMQPFFEKLKRKANKVTPCR